METGKYNLQLYRICTLGWSQREKERENGKNKSEILQEVEHCKAIRMLRAVSETMYLV